MKKIANIWGVQKKKEKKMTTVRRSRSETALSKLRKRLQRDTTFGSPVEHRHGGDGGGATASDRHEPTEIAVFVRPRRGRVQRTVVRR